MLSLCLKQDETKTMSQRCLKTILNAGSSEKCLFVEHLKEYHKERERKPQIVGGILYLPKKFSKTREASI